MVLQIRFAIWLILQIEVEALHICKPSHHFASTISAFHVGLRPAGSAPTPRDFSTPVRPPCRSRPPSLPRVPALQLPRVPAIPPAAVRARPPASSRRIPPPPRCCAPPPARYLHESQFRGGVHTLGLRSLNAKSLGVGLFLDFANEFGTLQTTPNAKFICKVPWRCSNSPISDAKRAIEAASAFPPALHLPTTPLLCKTCRPPNLRCTSRSQLLPKSSSSFPL